MKYFWPLSNSITALYGAAVVGLSAVLMHLWQAALSDINTARVISALAIFAFHTLALMALGQQRRDAKLTKLVALLWHLGLWCFVWTIMQKQGLSKLFRKNWNQSERKLREWNIRYRGLETALVNPKFFLMSIFF